MESYVELPQYSPVAECYNENLSDAQKPTLPQPAIETYQLYGTTAPDDYANVLLPINYIGTNDEIPDVSIQGNDTVSLNYFSIIPVKDNEIEDNTNP